MNSIVTWYGGKGCMWKKIVPHFPEHTTYVEPFGGAASVLLNKEPSKLEVYNDIDNNIVTIFKALRDYPEELQMALQLTPYSREEFARSIQPVEDDISEVEKARRLIVRYRMCFSGKGQTATPERWSYSIFDSTRVNTWLNMADKHIIKIIERFRHVQIENKSWEDILTRYDTPGTLFYCDPPYMHSTRKTPNGYLYEMSVGEHELLASKLNVVQGKVVLSGYNSPEYAEWYKDWRVVEFCVRMQAANAKTATQDKRTEVLWIKE